MKPGLSLGADLTQARRAVPLMSRQDLESRLDSTLVELAGCREMLNQAMLRVTELELREIAGRPPAERHHNWATELFAGLGLRA
jgi:hypothetical protein